MQNFEVFEYENDVYKNIVLMKTVEDLYYLKDEIYETLSKINGKEFTILVDLFLRNGYSFNRFVAVNFNGKEQCKFMIINPREISEDIKSKIKNYLKMNSEILENSALTQKAISFVKSTAT